MTKRAFNLDAGLVQAEEVDFSGDPRPSCLNLDGRWTYAQLGVTPGSLAENLRIISGGE